MGLLFEEWGMSTKLPYSPSPPYPGWRQAETVVGDMPGTLNLAFAAAFGAVAITVVMFSGCPLMNYLPYYEAEILLWEISIYIIE